MALSRWQIKINYLPRDFDLICVYCNTNTFLDKINIIFITSISYHALTDFNFFQAFHWCVMKEYCFLSLSSSFWNWICPSFSFRWSLLSQTHTLQQLKQSTLTFSAQWFFSFHIRIIINNLDYFIFSHFLWFWQILAFSSQYRKPKEIILSLYAQRPFLQEVK